MRLVNADKYAWNNTQQCPESRVCRHVDAKVVRVGGVAGDDVVVKS